MCINLTNSSNEICEFLNKDLSLSTLLAKTITSNPKHYSDADHSPASKSTNPAIAKEDHEKAESRFELLLLSLGLMINFVQESDLVKDLILSHPLADDIKTIFETLITGDVVPYIRCLCLQVGTSESCVGISCVITRASDYSFKDRKEGRG